MAKVFIVQDTPRRVNGVMVAGNDYSAALEFGELHYVLKTPNISLMSEAMVEEITFALKDMDDTDCLICVGDPIAIGTACAVAAKYNKGKFNFLRWKKANYHNDGKYTKQSIQL